MCKIVNTAIADNNIVWLWQCAHTPRHAASQGRQAVYTTSHHSLPVINYGKVMNEITSFIDACVVVWMSSIRYIVTVFDQGRIHRGGEGGDRPP